MTRFERRLRECVDSKYLREPTPDNPLWRLVNDRLPLDECRAFYVGLRDSLAVFNRVLLGQLLEECPTEKARSELLPVIAVEFGPPASAAHPAIFNRFLRSLGVSESDMRESADLLAATSACAAEVEAIRKMSWCELLARLLVGETQGPVVFPVILDALRRNYGLRASDVQYFSIHATHDKKDTEILFDLLARTAKSEADQEAVLRVVDEAFDGGRYVVTGCRLEASPRYRFADYSSTKTRKKEKATDLSSIAPSAVPAELERTIDNALTVPIREVVHRARVALQQRSLAESANARLTETGFVGNLLERARSAAHEWEFVIAPRLLQMCPDLDARVLLWQVAHESYGAKRGETPAMKLLVNLLSTLSDQARGLGEDPSRRAGFRQLTFLELVARGLVADNLIALEYLPVVRETLLAPPFQVRESDLGYFDRALRDASLGLEAGIDLLTRYATAHEVDDLVERALEHALDASPYAPLTERAAHHPHSWSNVDVSTTTA